MNATYNEQELGKLLSLATVRAHTSVLRTTSSKSRAPSSTDRAHRWLQPCGLLGWV